MIEPEFDDRAWEQVRLPHTCKELPLHYFDEQLYQMEMCYRLALPVPREWEGKALLLTVDGAAHAATLYVNGREITSHHCGYTAFTAELSGFVRYGAENCIALRVDSRETLDQPPFGFVVDYMTFGGISRGVQLAVKEPTHFDDVFLHSNRLDALESEITLSGQTDGCEVEQLLEGRRLGRVPARERMQLCFPVAVAPWSPESPKLYEITTNLLKNGEILDTHRWQLGFRTAEFRADGFYLNGARYQLRGLNRHQSYPYVGYAMPESVQRFDADILKFELGCNAVRTSHYPQSHGFLRRCAQIGLLVFTEMPGWQHIGGERWKQRAVRNVQDMVLQYRNHSPIFLWGVRINESTDDDELYTRTNAAAHALDSTRPTGGVRAFGGSHLLEDVYTYNDFLHDGRHAGCSRKKKITSDPKKGYLISEYNGHMYPTKSFDCEDHRTEHALRHANVLDAVAANGDIAGSFGWCMFDYNTHKDFGSGDRICYHGVMDPFRNPKLAAAVYAMQQEESPVLALSSSMDIGEHPACTRGSGYLFTNAEEVRMLKNGRYIRSFYPRESRWKHLRHGPILIDDYIGDLLAQEENIHGAQERLLKDVLNWAARVGMNSLPAKCWLEAGWLMLRYGMRMDDAVRLYTQYVGDWGGKSTTYCFEAVRDGEVVARVTKEPVQSVHLCASANTDRLTEAETYDAAAIRITARDQNGNLASFYQEPVHFTVSGALALIGPQTVALQGGCGGTYVKTIGREGEGSLTITDCAGQETVLHFQVQRKLASKLSAEP